MSIEEFIITLEDPRRGEGKRHQLRDIIVIIFMAILSGQQSIKGFARFAKSNNEELTTLLSLKHGVPKFSTFQGVISHFSEQLLVSKFISWVSQYHKDWADEFIALDGKAVRATVTSGGTSVQNFVSVVNAFGHKSKMIYGMKSYENKKGTEVEIVRQLAQELGVKDVTFTLDALHGKKNSKLDFNPGL